MNQEYSLSKLDNIRNNISAQRSQFSTIGVIVDCTNPHRKDAKKDYCLKLKIIDSSSPNKPCVVFLYSKTAEEFPRNIKIGDLLFLNKYQFQIWNETSLQAKKQFKVLGSQFRFFNGQPSTQGYGQIGNQTMIDDFDSLILNKLKELRKFSSNFFKNNSVPLFSKSSKLASDFDLILKVLQTEKLNQGYKIHMTNTVNQFQINYNYDVNPGVYKIRSIADSSWVRKKCILIGNDYTCFIEIPVWMKSHDHTDWQKLIAGKNAGNTKAEGVKLTTKILNEVEGEENKQVRLADLVSQDIHMEEVCVTCQFIECFTNYKDALKRYDAHNHIQKRFQSAQGEYIYSVHYVITDESLKGQLYNVYLYTYDNRGLQFLPGLRPDKIFGRNILSFQQKYDHINDRLLQETELQTNPLKIKLSPMTNGRDTIYRIVDTELLL